MSNKYDNVPDFIDLKDLEVFALVFVYIVLDQFPSDLDCGTRFSRDTIRNAIAAKRLPHEALLAAAYFGFMPLWDSHLNFQATSKRLNKFERHKRAEEYRRDAAAREKSAASEYGLTRGELKRLYPVLNDAAGAAGYSSFRDIYRCDDDVLSDASLYCPTDRAIYASGPRYLWDFAKLANESGRPDLVIETCGQWVLLLHHEEDTVFGYALPPAGLRLGDFKYNGFFQPDVIEIQYHTEIPIISAPDEIQTALSSLSETRFPGRVLEFVPMPSAQDVMFNWTMLHSSPAEGA